MKPEIFVATSISPALSLLPDELDTPAARAMLDSIALQESRLLHRRQIRGPARSFYQFEITGIRGVLLHHASRPLALRFLLDLDYTADTETLYPAIEYDSVLASGMARLLLYTLPQALPGPNDYKLAWGQYCDAWRPGKPHASTWPELYTQAWQAA